MSKRMTTFRVSMAVVLLAAGALRCGGGHDFNGSKEKYFTPVHTDLTYLKDGWGRYVYLRGVNVSGSTKVPTTTDPVSYVGKPFPLEEADHYFRMLSDLGFNAIRLLVNWEGIEPYERGVYDEQYLDYIRSIVEIAARYDIYVLMDMHQDLWSRHLFVYYNDQPSYTDASGNLVQPPKGSLESMVLSLVPDDQGNYSDMIRGDGAPRWVVQAILPERNMDSRYWGTVRLLGELDDDTMNSLINILGRFMPAGTGSGDMSWFTAFMDRIPPEFDFAETTDVLPWTTWGINAIIGLDVQRSFATFLAGDKIFPGREIDGTNVKDYLQDAYLGAWLQVVGRVKDYPNVIGYDIMNEPVGIFLTYSAAALYFQTGMDEGVRRLLDDLLGVEVGPQAYDLITSLQLIPPDRSTETIRKWGFEGADLSAILDLNIGFDQKYLQPFYEKVGQAIQEEDPGAVIWFEPSLNASLLLGDLGAGMMEINMRRPRGVDQVVYSPHWYTDIYPMIGLNMPPRDFTAAEVRFRDYGENLKDTFDKSAYSLGNIPVVFGEFGTYFNFGGIDRSVEEDYAVSANILDNYYEGFESLGLGGMIWCFSAENDARFGDLWNKEDFSIVGPLDPADNQRHPRAEEAYSRPYPRFLSGKLIDMHFYSDYHYFDPDKGIVNPEHEFELKFESKETSAPTEIFVPAFQYPEGFYVWVSDGTVMYDKDGHILYFFPERDEPGAVHSIRLLPPLEANENLDWDYFVDAQSGQIVSRD
jgi:hypothetical protein